MAPPSLPSQGPQRQMDSPAQMRTLDFMGIRNFQISFLLLELRGLKVEAVFEGLTSGSQNDP